MTVRPETGFSILYLLSLPLKIKLDIMSVYVEQALIPHKHIKKYHSTLRNTPINMQLNKPTSQGSRTLI